MIAWAALATFALLGQQEPQDPAAKMTALRNPYALHHALLVREDYKPLSPAKIAPIGLTAKLNGDGVNPWAFSWVVSGFGRTGTDKDAFLLRFRAFTNREDDTLPTQAVRQLLRLWELGIRRIGIDHPGYNRGTIDLYSSPTQTWRSTTGIQPRSFRSIMKDREGGTDRDVNAIFIFDGGSRRSGLDVVEELCGLYGEAMLFPIDRPAQGGKTVNDRIGRSLYLHWLSDGLAKQLADPEDAFGCDAATVAERYEKVSMPTVEKVLTQGPDFASLAKGFQATRSAYADLMIYADAILPAATLATAMRNAKPFDPSIWADVLVQAEQSGSDWTVPIPAGLKGRHVWIPVGTARVVGGTVMASVRGWSQVMPTAEMLRVETKRASGASD